MADAISRGRKYTTLEELEQQDKGPVWVLNNTRDALEGQVVVSIAKRNGNGYDRIRVPRSFVPFDLTQQIPRLQLLESADFRHAINTRLLKLVTSEYAAVLRNTDEAKEEMTRLKNDEQKAKMALKKAGIMADGQTPSSGVGDDDDDEFFEVAGEGGRSKKGKKAAEAKKAQSAKAAEATTSTKKQPSMKVQALVAAATRDEMTEVQIVAKLKNMTLKRVDLAFLARNYQDKPRIMKHLKAVKKELEAETA